MRLRIVFFNLIQGVRREGILLCFAAIVVNVSLDSSYLAVVKYTRGKFIMEKYSINQRVLIVKTFYQNQSSITVTMRKLREIFGRNNVPTKRTIYRVVNDFEERGSVSDRPKHRPQRTARSAENITAAQESVQNNPSTSIRRRAQELGLQRTSLATILHKDLHLFPFKIQLTQELLPQDHLRRRTYANRMLQLAHDNPDFHEKIIMSDEAHFHLNGYVNKQNSRFWAMQNPQIIHQSPLHPLKVTVWCAIWSGGIMDLTS